MMKGANATMPKNIQSVIRSIFAAELADQTECVGLREVLYAFIQAELEGREAASSYPDVNRHIMTCSECRTEYLELRALLQRAREGQLSLPRGEPAFDFSYLQEMGALTGQLWRHLECAGRQVLRLVTEITVAVGRLSARFEQIPPTLSIEPLAPVPTRDRLLSKEAPGERLSLPTPESDLTLLITVGPIAGHAATVIAQALRLSSQQPPPRSRISLLDRDGQVLASEPAGAGGQVVFEGVGTGSYFLELRSEGRTWELPLSLVLEQIETREERQG